MTEVKHDKLGDFVRSNIVGIIGVLALAGAGYTSIQVTTNSMQKDIIKLQDDLVELEDDVEEDVDDIRGSLFDDFTEITSIKREIYELQKSIGNAAR